MARFVNPKRYVKRSLFKELRDSVRIIASLPQLLSDRQHLAFKNWNRYFGDRYKIRIGGQTYVFLADPKSIQTCFELGEDFLDAGTARQRLLGFMPKHSLLLATGQRHQTMRRIVSQSVRAASRSKLNMALGSPASENIAANIEQALCRVVCDFLVGASQVNLQKVLWETSTVIDNISTAALIFPALKNVMPFRRGFVKVESAMRELNRILEKTMDDGPEDRSFMGQLMSHSRMEAINELEVRDNVAFFSLVMLRSLKILYNNVGHALGADPDWQQQLRASISHGDSSAARMIRATIKESLRISPMVPLVARHAKKSFDCNGLRVNQNDLIIITPYLTHFRPDSFADPERFDPRRFLGRKKYAYEFLPFGGGSHHCIGSGWTIDVMGEVFRRLLPQFEFLSDETDSSLSKYSMRAMLLTRPTNFIVRRVEDVAR